jgi:anti-sigma regulatory factor (Ser/Thr protein kinase)
MTPRIQEQHQSTSATRTTAVPLALTQAVTHQFPRHRRSVGRAREALRRQLAIWHVVGEVTDIATLLLSELATNAVNAKTTNGRDIAVRFELAGSKLRLEVSDTSDEQPTLKRVKNDDESGRGLVLVDTLTDGWGANHATQSAKSCGPSWYCRRRPCHDTGAGSPGMGACPRCLQRPRCRSSAWWPPGPPRRTPHRFPPVGAAVATWSRSGRSGPTGPSVRPASAGVAGGCRRTRLGTGLRVSGRPICVPGYGRARYSLCLHRAGRSACSGREEVRTWESPRACRVRAHQRAHQ